MLNEQFSLEAQSPLKKDIETINISFTDNKAEILRNWKGELKKIKQTQSDRLIKMLREDLDALKEATDGNTKH